MGGWKEGDRDGWMDGKKEKRKRWRWMDGEEEIDKDG